MSTLAIPELDRIIASNDGTAGKPPFAVVPGPHHLHGFRVRVPWRLRRPARQWLRDQGEIHGFVPLGIGLTGWATCQFMRQDAGTVRSFLASAFGPMDVLFVREIHYGDEE